MADQCAHEHEVVSAVLSRRWDALSGDVKQHADGCGICSEVMAVARLLAADHDRARADVRVPAAGQVWWRAAVRARLEAAHTAARPLTWLHGVAGACAAGLAIAAIGMAWPSLHGLVSWFTVDTLDVDLGVVGVAAIVAAALQKSLPLAAFVAACLVLAPVALYFALSDDSGR